MGRRNPRKNDGLWSMFDAVDEFLRPPPHVLDREAREAAELAQTGGGQTVAGWINRALYPPPPDY